MIRAVDRALSALEITMIVVLTLAGLAMAFVQVILRYVFNTGVHWLEAGLVTALVWAMLFGAVRAVRTGAHPRVDLLHTMVGARTRVVLNLLALLVTMALTGFYLWDSVFYASFLNKINALHPEFGIKQVYPFLIIPIITALMLIRYLMLAVALWRTPGTLHPEPDFAAAMDGEPTREGAAT
ncbi:MAG: TRAP transporter small permease subunit [Paracoccaceae bacterium]